MIKRPWFLMLLGWAATKYGPRVMDRASRTFSASAARRAAAGARGAKTSGLAARLLNSPTARKLGAAAFAWLIAKKAKGRR